MKVVNVPVPIKKGSVSWTTKPNSAKRWDDSSKNYFDIAPYGGAIPPIGNIVLVSPPSTSTRTRSSRHSITSKPKPSAPRPTLDAPPSSRTHGSKKKTSPPAPFSIFKRRACYL